MKERATFAQDILVEGAYLIEQPNSYDQQTIQKKWNDAAPGLMREWCEKLETLDDYSASSVETTFKSFITEKNLGIGAVLPLFRLLITGQGAGPSMFEITEFLGKNETIGRIKDGILMIEKQKANA